MIIICASRRASRRRPSAIERMSQHPFVGVAGKSPQCQPHPLFRGAVRCFRGISGNSVMRAGVDPHVLRPTSRPGRRPIMRCAAKRARIERNVAIPLRDGVRIPLADIYSPGGRDARLICRCCCRGTPLWQARAVEPGFLAAFRVDPTGFADLPSEGADPGEMGVLGYALAVVDLRGAWPSEGDFHHNGAVEALRDCADKLDRLPTQRQSNGRRRDDRRFLSRRDPVLGRRAQPRRRLPRSNPGGKGSPTGIAEQSLSRRDIETGFPCRASDNIRYSPNRTEDT